VLERVVSLLALDGLLMLDPPNTAGPAVCWLAAVSGGVYSPLSVRAPSFNTQGMNL
jgi:hypothetical protein